MENKKDKLDKEFEDWLDSMELTLPMPIPKEDESGKKQVVTTDSKETC